MKRRFVIALLAFGAVAALFHAATGRDAVTVSSMTLVTVPDRGRCIEVRLKNNSNDQVGCSLYRQQLFAGRWVPKSPTFFREDELVYIAAGAERSATFRIHDAGGSHRFEIHYGLPCGRLRRFVAMVRRKLHLGYRTQMLEGRHQSFTTAPIQIPPA